MTGVQTCALPISAENCLWRHKRANFPKHLAAQGLSLGGPAPALVVGEPQPLALELLAENAVLFAQVRDDILLLLIQPTGQCKDDELPCVKDYKCILPSHQDSGQAELDLPRPRQTPFWQITWASAAFWDHTALGFTP